MATLFAAGAASGTAAATTAAATAATTAATTGAVTTGLTASTLGASLLTDLSMLSMVRQGQAATISSKVQADRIKQEATGREVNRRQRLVSSLASQNATRAASGIRAFEGSSKGIMLEDIRRGEGSMLVERAGAGTQAASVLGAGQYSQNTSFINAGFTLLDQVNRQAERG